MKKTIVSLLAVAALFIVSEVNAQEKFPGLDASPLDVAYFPSNSANAEFRGPRVEAKILLYYSRPQLKGRSTDELVPNGKNWRFGANEATQITFLQDVTVGSTKVKAGSYVIFVDNKDGQWTFTLNSKLNTWGNFLKDGNEIVASVEGAMSTNSESVEALSMKFKEVDGGAHLVVGWGNIIAEMPIKM